MPMDRSKYPPDWETIAYLVKLEAGWKCTKCSRPHRKDIPSQILTTHHRDGNEADCSRENLVALCARCHLRAQGELLRQQKREAINREQRGLEL